MIEIKFTPSQGNWLEVTWADVVQLPDVEIPAKSALFDADGKEVQPAVEASTTPGAITRTELKHTSYHPTQLDLLQTDAEKMGTPLTAHADMLKKWVDSYVPPEPEPLTAADFDRALTAHLDAVAQQRQYDNRITCMVRAGFPGPFQAEGQAFAAWADGCNMVAYQLLQAVMAGKRKPPETTVAFVSELPMMVWP